MYLTIHPYSNLYSSSVYALQDDFTIFTPKFNKPIFEVPGIYHPFAKFQAHRKNTAPKAPHLEMIRICLHLISPKAPNHLPCCILNRWKNWGLESNLGIYENCLTTLDNLMLGVLHAVAVMCDQEPFCQSIPKPCLSQHETT